MTDLGMNELLTIHEGDRLAVRAAMMPDWIGMEFPDPRSQLFRWTDLQQRMIGGYALEGYADAEIARALGRATTLL